MKFFNKLSIGTSLVLARALHRRVPFIAQFTLTDRCNLRCKYCYCRYPERDNDQLSTEQVLKIVDEFAALGTRRLSLVGGEPLVRRDIGEIIQRVKALGMECALTTNGTLVPHRVDELRALDILCVSFDGPPHAHDAMRGSGSFREVMEAFECALENGIPLRAGVVLTKHNLHELDFIMDTARRYNFQVGFTTLLNQVSDDGKRAAEDIPTDQEYREVLRQIIQLKRRGEPILFSEKAYRFALQWPLSYKVDKVLGSTPPFPAPRCYAGRYFCLIDSNGDLYPCSTTVSDRVFGAEQGSSVNTNCVELGVRKAWDNLASHICQACHIPCNNEFNYFFGLDPGALTNIWTIYRLLPSGSK